MDHKRAPRTRAAPCGDHVVVGQGLLVQLNGQMEMINNYPSECIRPIVADFQVFYSSKDESIAREMVCVCERDRNSASNALLVWEFGSNENYY